MQISPGMLLNRFMRDVQFAGNPYIVRNFDNASENLSLEELLVETNETEPIVVEHHPTFSEFG